MKIKLTRGKDTFLTRREYDYYGKGSKEPILCDSAAVWLSDGIDPTNMPDAIELRIEVTPFKGSIVAKTHRVVFGSVTHLMWRERLCWAWPSLTAITAFTGKKILHVKVRKVKP